MRPTTTPACITSSLHDTGAQSDCLLLPTAYFRESCLYCVSVRPSIFSAFDGGEHDAAAAVAGADCVIAGPLSLFASRQGQWYRWLVFISPALPPASLHRSRFWWFCVRRWSVYCASTASTKTSHKDNLASPTSVPYSPPWLELCVRWWYCCCCCFCCSCWWWGVCLLARGPAFRDLTLKRRAWYRNHCLCSICTEVGTITSSLNLQMYEVTVYNVCTLLCKYMRSATVSNHDYVCAQEKVIIK